MSEVFNNDSFTTLAASIGAGDTSLTVASNVQFDTTGTFRIRIDDEVMTVTSVSGTTWTVTRASEKCEGVQVATTHNVNAGVYGVLTAGALQAMLGSGTVSSFGFQNTGGVSGSVTNPSTTPVLTITLGAISPTSVAASGAVTGSNLSGTNTGDQTITLTGDVTGSGTGSFVATIAGHAVTYAKIQQAGAATLLGNPDGGTANVSEITLGSGLSFSGTTLTATGSDGTVTTVSVVSANGVSGSVANPTTTPAITLTLGNITPSSVAASGTVTGSNISGSTSGTNTGDQTITLTSDVTGSGTGSFAATISSHAVTYAKMQQAGAATLLGNPTGGTANVEEITLGANLSFSGTTLVATGGGGSSPVGLVNGRLTLTTGVPVTTADVTTATTIYFTPYLGNQISLYSSGWSTITFAETSIALGTLSSGVNYDVFGYNNSGTLALEFSALWSSDTARTDALALQDGVLVKSSDHTRRYLGTFRTISTTQTADFGGGVTTVVGGQRFLWNMYNRVPRWLSVIDTSNTWTYTAAVWRQAAGNAGNKIEFVCGQIEDAFHATVSAMCNAQSNAFGYVAVGVNSTTAPTGLISAGYSSSPSIDMAMVASCYHVGRLGYNFVAWIENGGGSGAGFTFYGTDGTDQSGLNVMIKA